LKVKSFLYIRQLKTKNYERSTKENKGGHGEMRSTKELLILLREEVEGPEFELGMCDVINKMFVLEEISESEYIELNSYLYDNDPEYDETFWFPRGERQPRIDWINQQLRNMSKRE
jgi:hypothetical protein